MMELASKTSENDNDNGRADSEEMMSGIGEKEAIDYKLWILVWLSRLAPLTAALILFVYILYLIADSDNWSTDTDPEIVSDTDILTRTTNRGLFVSMVIAILLNLVGAFMFYIKVRESLVVTNYGFILGPVIGYMLDQAIGTDEGFSHFMTPYGFSFTFASLIDGNFMRYIVTIFLDLFISNPLQDILKTQVAKIGVIKALKDEVGLKGLTKREYLWKYDGFVALNYPSILQSIVAFVTFNAYTNQTRFAWAYPSESLDRAYRIPPGTIMLSTAIAGMLYLNFYTIMDYISDRQYFDVNVKLFYVIAIIGLLWGLNVTESIEAPVEGEEDNVITAVIDPAKPLLGILMFTGFVLYGFVYPVYTRLGCFGKCKPKESEQTETDHVAEIDEFNTINQATLQHIEEEIKRQIQKELNQQQEPQ